jgi:hypothetical protein
MFSTCCSLSHSAEPSLSRHSIYISISTRVRVPRKIQKNAASQSKHWTEYVHSRFHANHQAGTASLLADGSIIYIPVHEGTESGMGSVFPHREDPRVWIAGVVRDVTRNWNAVLWRCGVALVPGARVLSIPSSPSVGGMRFRGRLSG